MAFFDFIGNQPDQLSLAEILSTIPAIAGPVLMQRGRRVGLPLGMGLTALGTLGQTLAERKRQEAQRQGLAQSIAKMPGVTPEQQQFLNQYVSAGGDPSGVVGEIFKQQFAKPGLKPFMISNGQQERLFDPNKETTMPTGWYSSSFKPQKGEKQTPFDIWRQQNPTGTIADWEKLTHPTTNINVQTPLSPNDIVQDPETHRWGTYERSKSGDLTFKPLPLGDGAAPTRLPTPTKPAGKVITKTQIGGYDYEITAFKGDPLNGIVRPPKGQTFAGRHGLGTGIPQFLWRINGKFVDPKTLSKDQAKAYAKVLTDKGFSLDEIMPSGR